jgi:hypothetical protein
MSTTNPRRRFPTAVKATLPDKFETLVAEMRAVAAAIGKADSTADEWLAVLCPGRLNHAELAGLFCSHGPCCRTS